MIRFGEPLWFLALLIPLLLFFLDLLLRKTRENARSQFASQHLWKFLSPARSTASRRWKRIFYLAALFFLVIALANPQIGTRYEEVKREGIDIFLLIDVSRSMDTQDIRPSRLIKTRYELSRFLEGLQGDRIGIIPFAGTAYPLCPLTLDYSAAAMFLDLMDTKLIPTPGTAIGEAIQTALASLPEADGRSQAIVLVSDGEDHEGGVEDIAAEAGKKNIPIFSIGMALQKGDPIPEAGATGQKSGWKTDDDGRIVTSRLNEELLRKIASASGGKYFRATQGGSEFRSVYRHLFGMDREELSARRITDYKDRFQPLLIIVLILLVMEFAIPNVKKIRTAQ